MKLYGLTGGPGMGKSEAAAYLAEKGVPLVDTDTLARDVVSLGQIGLQEVARVFGNVVIGPQGELRRDKLAEVVFNDPLARARLEGILHPLIREAWQAKAEEWRRAGATAGVVVIPLLFETEAEHFFESVICIACSFQRQSARLHSRGWTAEQVSGRLRAQWPVEKKMDRSQFVIWNNGTLAALREQLGRVPPLKGRVEPDPGKP